MPMPDAGPVVYPEPPFVPVSNRHPRVYFTAADLPQIRENQYKPQNRYALEKLLAYRDTQTDGRLPQTGQPNFDPDLLCVIESCAFDHAVNANAGMGEKAISLLRAYLETETIGDNYNLLGQVIFTVSEVYDWCYDLLDDATRAAFCAAALDRARRLEIGYPPTKQGAVTTHAVEAQLMRDLLCLGLATYDETPAIYQNAAGRFFSEFIPARRFQYEALMHSQGTTYTAYRAQWEILATWIFHRLGLPEIFGPNQRYVLYGRLYARRPDGQLLRDGDTDQNNLPYGQYDSRAARSLLHMANYFHDPYLKAESLREMPEYVLPAPRWNQHCSPAEFLAFNDPDLEGLAPGGLPPAFYFPSPKGAILARTRWESTQAEQPVLVEMKINEWWFSNHQHLDAGAFQIHYRAPLATDMGYYHGALRSGVFTPDNNGNTDYASMHDASYNKRTIAHNALLVHDPKESFQYFLSTANDGGQRVPNRAKEPPTLEALLDPENGYRIGEVLGHEIRLDGNALRLAYLKGDIAAAYSDKVSAMERSFVFLPLEDPLLPAMLIVFDRIIAADPSFRKAWMVNGLHEPALGTLPNRVVLPGDKEGLTSRLTLDILLPEANDTSIDFIGGPGREAFVDGINYPGTPLPGGSNEGHGWRVEVSPRTARAEDCFLTVLHIGDAGGAPPPEQPRLGLSEGFAQVSVHGHTVLFANKRGCDDAPVDFVLDTDGQVVVTDRAPGDWDVFRDGARVETARVTPEGGIAMFFGRKGRYRLVYVGAWGLTAREA